MRWLRLRLFSQSPAGPPSNASGLRHLRKPGRRDRPSGQRQGRRSLIQPIGVGAGQQAAVRLTGNYPFKKPGSSDPAIAPGA